MTNLTVSVSKIGSFDCMGDTVMKLDIPIGMPVHMVTDPEHNLKEVVGKIVAEGTSPDGDRIVSIRLTDEGLAALHPLLMNIQMKGGIVTDMRMEK